MKEAYNSYAWRSLRIFGSLHIYQDTTALCIAIHSEIDILITIKVHQINRQLLICNQSVRHAIPYSHIHIISTADWFYPIVLLVLRAREKERQREAKRCSAKHTKCGDHAMATAATTDKPCRKLFTAFQITYSNIQFWTT